MLSTEPQLMRQEHRCLSCGYRLDGLTEPRCPECGRGFDARDPTTWRSGRWNPENFRVLTAPPGWIFHSMCIFLALLSLGLATAPGGYVDMLFILMMAWFALAVIWFVRWLLAMGTKVVWGWPQISQKRSGWHWLADPAIVGVLMLIIMADIPFRISFFLSRPALERHARQVVNSPGEHPGPTSGFVAWNIETVRSEEGRVYIDFPDTGLSDFRALVYSPSGSVPTYSGDESVRHIMGDWYLWREIF